MPMVRAEFPVKCRRSISFDFPWRNRASRMEDCIGVMVANPPLCTLRPPSPACPPGEALDTSKDWIAATLFRTINFHLLNFDHHPGEIAEATASDLHRERGYDGNRLCGLRPQSAHPRQAA